MDCRAFLMAISSVALAFTLPADTYTSASYVQSGLIAQWDGINNAGTGTHDPTATVWKDLKGNNDLTIVGGLHATGRNAEWRRGIALYFDTMSLKKAAAYGTETATTYKTIEVVYKMTSRDNSRILFWGGDRSRYVLFDHSAYTYPFSMVYFDGSDKTKTDVNRTLWAKVKTYDPTSAVATYDDSDNVTDIFIDGAGKADNRLYNTWNPGDNRVTLGGRSVDTAVNGWAGEVYAIRLYSRALTPEEIARNHAIDVKRFFTSAMYDPTNMVSFWDAKDNVGVGQHDSTATTWKNLVAGAQDLTLDSRVGSWTDNALYCNGSTLNAAAYGTNTLAYSSLEVLFRNERPAGIYNSYLFSNGSDRYCVLAGGRVQWQDYVGIHTFDYTQGGDHSLSWARGTGASAADATAYIDGEKTNYEQHNDYWGVGGAFVQVGGRSTGGQSYGGRIYSVRTYSSKLSFEKVYENRKIDEVRYANAIRWNGGDGSFGAVANWRDVDAAAAVPGSENTVELPYGTYTITLDQDRTVSAMRARNGHMYYFPSRLIDATLDMGGHKLTVMGAYKAASRSGYNDRRFARLNLTNGTFQAESVRIGSLADRIVDNVKWINYAEALQYGSGSLYVEGPDTVATIRKTVALEGPCTTLRVAGGATFSCDDLLIYSTKNRISSYPTGKYDRALAEFTGAGTTATLGKFCGYNDVDVVVSNGASVVVNGSTEKFAAVGCYISSIGRSFESLPGSGSIVVDDATLTLKSQGFAVGVTYLAPGSGNSSMTLRNNATLTLTTMSRFFVGVGANNATSETGCFLNVLSGSTLNGGPTQLEVGPVGNTSFSGINVDNATVNCGVIYLGSKSSETCSSNNLLHVSGAAPRINLASEASTSLQLRMGTRLKFTIPEDGFAATPIVTAGGVHVEPDETLYAVDPVKLVIDASAFEGDRVTLISCASNSTESLQRLARNTEYIGKHRGRVKVEDGGTELVWFRPSTRITIR